MLQSCRRRALRALHDALRRHHRRDLCGLPSARDSDRVDDLVARSLAHIPPAEGGRPLRVAVAMSGGVDSSVAAHLLQRQGCDVFAVFMRTWDAAEEGAATAGACTAESDLRDAHNVCRTLGIPLHVVDFVPRYWQDVFCPFVEAYASGITPNPDLSCNQRVKFGALLRRAIDDLGADALATGHYARVHAPPSSSSSTSSSSSSSTPLEVRGPLRLRRGRDRAKDQSYFLSRIDPESLRRVAFPLGDVTKPHVRRIAAGLDLPNAEKKGSVGICFIGKRSFNAFLSQYVELTPGAFVCVDSGVEVGKHGGSELYTRGQGARIPGAQCKWYVVGKRKGAVFVCQGPDHAALASDGAILRDVRWFGEPSIAPGAASDHPLECQARYNQEPGWCRVHRPGEGPTHVPSEWWGAGAGNGVRESLKEGVLQADFSEPYLHVTPGQALVLYRDDLLLGSGLIHTFTQRA